MSIPIVRRLPSSRLTELICSSTFLVISLTKKAKDYIVDKGWDSQFGARPLKRAIQKYVEDILAEEMIKTKIKAGDMINIDYDKKKDMIVVKISKPVIKQAVKEKSDK